MATLRLSFPEGPAWSQRVQLDGLTYIIRAKWNDRMETWTIDIASRDDSPIVTGIRLVKDYPLLLGVVESRRPPGELYVISTSMTDPSRESFETGEARLIYIEADE